MDDGLKEKKELISNILIMGFSIVVIAAITIAIVAQTDSSRQGAGTMKTLVYICSKTDDPENCLHTLKHVGERATVLDYVKASINATHAELMVVDMPKSYLESVMTIPQAQSYRDCLQILNLGREELESLYVMANSASDMSKMNIDDVINSLSAVISYQQTCSDELLRTNSFEIFGYSLRMPILLTRITLAIVINFSGGDSNFKVEPAYKPSLRRVLTGATNLGKVDSHKHDGFPTWFSATERKLLDSGGQRPNAVVAQDGSGQFSTITGSLNACPKKSQCIIYVKKGRYEERVVVRKDLDQVLMYGDGPMNTIVVNGIIQGGGKTVATPFQAATFVVMAKGFICKDMAFTATSDIKGTPALLVLSDHAAFFNCKIEGEEGTLFAVAQRQFYRNCEIHGNMDIIKGDSATVIQNSQIIVKARNNSSNTVLKPSVVSAQSRVDKNERTGFVIQNCTITAHPYENMSLADTAYLGTPYKEYSRTIIMESFLGDVINPEGWRKWSDSYGTETATFREYNNRGSGARTDNRVSWYSYRTTSHKAQMTSFTAGQFIQTEQWLQSTGIPYESGFVF